MMQGMERGWPRAIDMNDKQLHTLAELRAFLDGTVAVALGQPLGYAAPIRAWYCAFWDV